MKTSTRLKREEIRASLVESISTVLESEVDTLGAAERLAVAKWVALSLVNDFNITIRSR